MEIRERRISSQDNENLFKLYLNEQNDYIYINDKDASLFDHFAEFINWIDEKTEEMQKQEKEYAKRYGKEIIKRDENGNVEGVNAIALLELSKIRMQTYKDTVERLDLIFGTGTIGKFFKASYEINPEFIPDDECIFDFLEEITPVLNDLFADRKKRVDLKYNKNRKGSRGNKYRTKSQLIEGYAGA